MLTRKSTATCAGTRATHAESAPRQHKTHTSKGKSKATARRERTRLKPSKVPPGCLPGIYWGGPHACEARHTAQLGRRRHTLPPHTHTSTYTALQNANNDHGNDASSLTRRRCRTRRSRTGCTCRWNAGESRLPRSSPLLCACKGRHSCGLHRQTADH